MERNTMTNTNKLKGRIVEKGFTLSTFSDKIGLTRQGFRKKISGISDFKLNEIQRICAALEIQRDDICDYFFADYVPDSETNKRSETSDTVRV